MPPTRRNHFTGKITPYSNNNENHNRNQTIPIIEDIFEVIQRDLRNDRETFHVIEEETIEQLQYLLSAQRIAIVEDYFETQTGITKEMRKILVDWLHAVMTELNYSPLCLSLSISFLDRYCSNISSLISRETYQLVGLTCVFISSKLEEVRPVGHRSLLRLTNDVYHSEQMLALETEILNFLNFNLNAPTSSHFLEFFTQIANETENQVEILAQYLNEVSFMNSEMTFFEPAMVAASALFLSFKKNNKSWCNSITNNTRYNSQNHSFIQCIMRLMSAWREVTEENSVKQKYIAILAKSGYNINLLIPPFTL